MAAIDKRSCVDWGAHIKNKQAPALSQNITRKVEAMKQVEILRY